MHGELFSVAAETTSLAVQLCYYRGMAGFHSSHWVTEPGALLDEMSGVCCEAGITQIGRLLRHALDSGSALHGGYVLAKVF